MKARDKLKLKEYDRPLLVVGLVLLCLGIIIISSASIMESEKLYGDPFYLTIKHIISLTMALCIGIICAATPTVVVQRLSIYALFAVLLLLVAVLMIGREVNEAKRWINLGFFNAQPAEFLKLVWIIYFSSYTAKKLNEVDSFKGFLKPVIFVCLFAGLLLSQPDFGSLVVVTFITGAIMWAASAGVLRYIMMAAALVGVGYLLIVTQPYRMRRITSFLDPWQDPFGDGYQLTQSLMAFGRGGLWGEGLGNSIQKLGYLPEAHTDFVTSIFGEELGFVGMLVLILLEFFIIVRAIHLGFKVLKYSPCFQGFVAYGIGIWFSVQTVVNIGMASGGLPTKGLTLPLVSFGGSSMIVCCAAIGVLLRIDYEYRHDLIQTKIG